MSARPKLPKLNSSMPVHFSHTSSNSSPRPHQDFSKSMNPNNNKYYDSTTFGLSNVRLRPIKECFKAFEKEVTLFSNVCQIDKAFMRYFSNFSKYFDRFIQYSVVVFNSQHPLDDTHSQLPQSAVMTSSRLLISSWIDFVMNLNEVTKSSTKPIFPLILNSLDELNQKLDIVLQYYYVGAIHSVISETKMKAIDEGVAEIRNATLKKIRENETSSNNEKKKQIEFPKDGINELNNSNQIKGKNQELQTQKICQNINQNSDQSSNHSVDQDSNPNLNQNQNQNQIEQNENQNREQRMRIKLNDFNTFVFDFHSYAEKSFDVIQRIQALFSREMPPHRSQTRAIMIDKMALVVALNNFADLIKAIHNFDTRGAAVRQTVIEMSSEMTEVFAQLGLPFVLNVNQKSGEISLPEITNDEEMMKITNDTREGRFSHPRQPSGSKGSSPRRRNTPQMK